MITGRVYFVQAGESGPIKIGFARKVQRRIATLQTGQHERLRLIADCPGSRGHEQEFHKALAAHRLDGEWFSPHEDVMRAIKAARLYAFGHGEDVPEEIERLAVQVLAITKDSTDPWYQTLNRRFSE